MNITKGTIIMVAIDGHPKPVKVVFDHWGDHGFMVCNRGTSDGTSGVVYIPRTRLRQPDMNGYTSAMYYSGPICFRCERPGDEVCVDDITADEYDHHLDEPRGSGYSEREVYRPPLRARSLHGTGTAID